MKDDIYKDNKRFENPESLRFNSCNAYKIRVIQH